jgi:DNA-directed RNA polymerase specialized sigma24 family protein
MTPSTDGDFPSTCWSMVRAAAGDLHEGQARSAFERLFSAYRGPITAYFRSRLRCCRQDAGEADELTQALFTNLLARQTLAGVTEDYGARFRCWLRRVAHNLHIDWARKRGWGVALEVEVGADDEQFREADLELDREWARQALQRAWGRLARAYATPERQPYFTAFVPFLVSGEEGKLPAVTIAERLGRTENAVRVAFHRFCNDLRGFLAEEAAVSPEEADAELGYLRDVLRGVRAEEWPPAPGGP